MIGSKMTVTITKLDAEGIGTKTDIDAMSGDEAMVSIGALVVDVVEASKGELDIEKLINVIRVMYYEGL